LQGRVPIVIYAQYAKRDSDPKYDTRSRTWSIKCRTTSTWNATFVLLTNHYASRLILRNHHKRVNQWERTGHVPWKLSR